MALYGGLGLLLYQITTKLLLIILNMPKKSTSSIPSRKVICAPIILSKMKHKMYQATKRLQLLRIFKINIYFIFLSCWERWFNPFFLFNVTVGGAVYCVTDKMLSFSKVTLLSGFLTSHLSRLSHPLWICACGVHNELIDVSLFVSLCACGALLMAPWLKEMI